MLGTEQDRLLGQGFPPRHRRRAKLLQVSAVLRPRGGEEGQDNPLHVPNNIVTRRLPGHRGAREKPPSPSVSSRAQATESFLDVYPVYPWAWFQKCVLKLKWLKWTYPKTFSLWRLVGQNAAETPVSPQAAVSLH